MVDRLTIKPASPKLNPNTQSKPAQSPKTKGDVSFVSRNALAQRIYNASEPHKDDKKPQSASSVLHDNSISNDRRDKASISSHTHHHGVQGSSDQPSNSYSDEWASVLPSVRDILEQENRSYQSKQEPSLGRLSSSSLCATNEGTAEQVQPGSSVKKFDLPGSNSDTLDIEDALIGLDDSIAMQPSLPTDDATKPLRKGPGLAEHQHQLKKLFCTTDSPEKAISPKNKRGASDCDLEAPSQTAPPQKRPKSVINTDRPLLLTRSTDEDTSILCSLIKPGLPAWVYEFDPAFIAEYQDFVDFV